MTTQTMTPAEKSQITAYEMNEATRLVADFCRFLEKAKYEVDGKIIITTPYTGLDALVTADLVTLAAKLRDGFRTISYDMEIHYDRGLRFEFEVSEL